jgi:hypothetical protein
MPPRCGQRGKSAGAAGLGQVRWLVIHADGGTQCCWLSAPLAARDSPPRHSLVEYVEYLCEKSRCTTPDLAAAPRPAQHAPGAAVMITPPCSYQHATGPVPHHTHTLSSLSAPTIFTVCLYVTCSTTHMLNTSNYCHTCAANALYPSYTPCSFLPTRRQCTPRKFVRQPIGASQMHIQNYPLAIG